MLRTILFLLFTIVVVPILAFYFGESLTPEQSTLFWESSMILGGIVAYCFIVGELTKNYSQVDKLWSIAPLIYAWYITAKSAWDPRMILMSSLVSLWGIRLTLNFARRGGYSWRFWEGDEDYRWAILQERPLFKDKPLVWTIFNLFFICGYQQTLIFLFTLPILTGLAPTAPEGLIGADYLLAAIIVGMVIIEIIADQQQWNFQTEKYRRINAGEDLGEYAHGFIRTGLWGIVRHPNYAGEQGVWLFFYGFSIICMGASNAINWSIMGCLLLVILFKGSSDFSEDISAKKYPEYKEYQKKVPRFIPFFPF